MNILITGACSGIGLDVGKRLAMRGHQVYLGVHTNTQNLQLRKRIKEYKNIHCFKLDVTNSKDLKKIEDLDIDVFFSNAAVGYSGSILEIPMSRIKNNFEVNVFSSLKLIQIIFKKMMNKGSGRIIIMSSLLGDVPMKFLGVYSSTKAAINSLALTLKKEIEMLNKNIKVCLIKPGAYNTGFNQIMIENKYSWMKTDSYYKKILYKIRDKEIKTFKLIEKKNNISIVSKIEDAILSSEPKFVYTAPFFQSLIIKSYKIIKFKHYN